MPTERDKAKEQPTRQGLRKQLESYFKTRSDLDAFCIDCFPDTYRELSPAMPRTEVITQLFARNSIEDIQNCYIKYREKIDLDRGGAVFRASMPLFIP